VYESLTIDRFRGLKHLELPRLARVNLLVGPNGIGKTTVLEAVWLHSNPFAVENLWKMDATFRDVQWDLSWSAAEVRKAPWDHLFYGFGPVRSFRIGAIVDGVSTGMEIVEDPTPTRQGVLRTSPRSSAEVATAPAAPSTTKPERVRRLTFRITNEGREEQTFDLNWIPGGRLEWSQPSGTPLKAAVGISPYQGRNLLDVAQQFSIVQQMKRDGDVLRFVHHVKPNVHRIGIALTPSTGVTIVADVASPVLMPVSYLGDGFLTALRYAVYLAGMQEAVILIDEVWAGVYYACLKDLWSALHDFASKNDCQVIATTHSLECVEAAMAAVPAADLLVHRLYPKDPHAVGVSTLDNETLRASRDMGLEVR
jgi:energy-coupling factor transporter ATP-binding protein EcfA2